MEVEPEVRREPLGYADRGKWTARKTPTKSVDELVRERTSPAVKSALKSLLEAPAGSGAAKKTKKGKANA